MKTKKWFSYPLDPNFLWKCEIVYSKGAIRPMWKRCLFIAEDIKYACPPLTVQEEIMRRRMDLIEKRMWSLITTGRF